MSDNFIKFKVVLDEDSGKVYALMLKTLLRLKGMTYVNLDIDNSKITFFNASYTFLSTSPFDIEVIETKGEITRKLFKLNAEAIKSIFEIGATIKLYDDCIKSTNSYISSSLVLDTTDSTIELKDQVKEIKDMQDSFADPDCLFKSDNIGSSLALSVLSTGFSSNKNTIIQVSKDGLLAFCGGVYLISETFDRLKESGDIFTLKSNDDVFFLNEFIASIVTSFVGVFDKVYIRFANKKVQISGEIGDKSISVINSDMQDVYGNDQIVSNEDVKSIIPNGNVVTCTFKDVGELINGVQAATQSLNDIGLSYDKSTWFLLETSGAPALKVLQSENSSSEIIVNLSDEEIDVKTSHIFTPFAIQIPVAILKAFSNKELKPMTMSFTNVNDDTSSAVSVKIGDDDETTFLLSKKFI